MLLYFHGRLQKWHDFLYNQILPNCSGSTAELEPSHNGDPTPCLVVYHPWETEIEMTSPLWKYAMENVTKAVVDAGWSPNFDIPASVKSTFDYPGDIAFKTLLYLLNYLSDRSKNDGHLTNDERLPSLFQMVDVGFTSALTKANQDLQQIGHILSEKHVIAQPSRNSIEMATSRTRQSNGMLQRMWDEREGAFFNSIVNHNDGESAPRSSNCMKSLNLPLGSNFDALWAPISNMTMVEQMSSHLLQHSGRYSFYCGDYPLWSLGGCGESDGLAMVVLMLRNYRVSKGLRNNKEIGVARFLERSSLNLICGLPNSDDSVITNCSGSQRLKLAFNATSGLPLGGLTSTLTAAIILDFLHPDKIFKYESGPPISASSVIVLIAMELVVAFSVGLTCLLLSLNLMRMATADEEGDAFVQIIREEQPEMELLVQTPVEDSGETNSNYEAVNDSGSIFGFIPLTFWWRN
jgi:hypothetical protein